MCSDRLGYRRPFSGPRHPPEAVRITSHKPGCRSLSASVAPLQLGEASFDDRRPVLTLGIRIALLDEGVVGQFENSRG